MHQKDALILQQIKNYLGVGFISPDTVNKTLLNYRISSIKDLVKIIDHLDKYPLITQKLADYELFKQGYYIAINKEHITLPGLHKIVALKASMNKGLSDYLKTCFPSIIPNIRPLVLNKTIPDPHWLSGFVAAEGCFFVGINKSSTIKVKYNVQLEFQITQHIRDKCLLNSFVEYLNCGKAYDRDNVTVYRVSRFTYLSQIIIPFFKKYNIPGVKI